MKFVTELIKENKIKFDITIWEDEKLVWLNNLIIPKKLRNRGLGTNVMNEFIKWLDKNKYNSILLVFNGYGSDEERLIEFYKHFGYTDKLYTTNSLYLMRNKYANS